MKTTMRWNAPGGVTATTRPPHPPVYATQRTTVRAINQAPSIYFVGPYKPIMCGIADYTSFIAHRCPAGRWGVVSFNLEHYGTPLTDDNEATSHRVWYGIPGRQDFSASAIRQGLNMLKASLGNSTLWFQHEFGIWPDNQRFVAMLKNLVIPRIVTFHTIHFQSQETGTGLRQEQHDFLQILLPRVEAITVFSRGVYRAVTAAFPQHRQKVHIIKHGIHAYPEISRLSRQQAREKLGDFLLYQSDLDPETKRRLHQQRLFSDEDTVIIGQTGFLSPAKGSELLYPVRDRLQKAIPQRRIVAMRIGHPRDETQIIYARKLHRQQKGSDKFFLETWLPQDMLPLAQRAFDINFYWPRECTQSGVLAHALGAGAIIAGRDLEGLGETLKDIGEPADRDLGQLIIKIRELVLKPELVEEIEAKALGYAAQFSWENQARQHYALAERILPPAAVKPPRLSFSLTGDSTAHPAPGQSEAPSTEVAK